MGQIKHTLDNIPQTFDETYRRILARIPEMHLNLASRLLQLLVYSRRSLILEEVIDALAVQTHPKPHFSIESRMPNPFDLTLLCPGLITIIEEPGNKILSQEQLDQEESVPVVKQVRLAHLSVQEYLMSTSVETRFSRSLHEVPAKTSLALTCFAYLTSLPSEEFRDGLERHCKISERPIQDYLVQPSDEDTQIKISEWDISAFVNEYPFSGYAIHGWPLYANDVMHIVEVQDRVSEIKSELQRVLAIALSLSFNSLFNFDGLV